MCQLCWRTIANMAQSYEIRVERYRAKGETRHFSAMLVMTVCQRCAEHTDSLLREKQLQAAS